MCEVSAPSPAVGVPGKGAASGVPPGPIPSGVPRPDAGWMSMPLPYRVGGVTD